MDTMRDALNSAIDDLDDASDLDETPQVVESADDDVTLEAGDTATEGAADDQAEDTDENKEGAEADEQLSSAEAAADASSDPTEDDKPTDSLKAPVGWSPKEREQWSKVPRALQERITAREQEMAQSMAGTKEARQTHEYMGQIANQFGSVLAADGFKHPMEAVQAAFGTMAALRMGTPEQKAQELARLVGQYGVDINALDQALVGQPAAQADPQASQLEQMLEQKLAPVQQFMQTVEQLQSHQQNAGREQANTAVKDFASQAEFLADVRTDMADIIDIAAKHGQQLTLQQAYDRACAAHPEISNIIAERKRNEAITGGKQAIDSKREAASSVVGRQSGSGGRQGNLSLRGAIAAAFDDAANG